MFFYLHCGRGFNCLHGRRMKRCLTSYFLCGNPQNSFGPHKAPRHTWHIWTSLFASRPSLNTCNIAVSCYCGQRSAYCDVLHSSDVVRSWGGLRTGMDGHGSLVQVNPGPCSMKSEFLQSTWWKCFLPLPKNHYSAAS